MTTFRLKYTHSYKDRHSKVRHYFRRNGFKNVSLPGLPGSDEFMDAYRAALKGETNTQINIGASRTKPGTINALTVAYFNSPEFQKLAPSTKQTYRGIIENFRRKHGDKQVATLKREHIKKMRDAKSETPSAANNWLRMVRMLMQLAIEEGFRGDDPTVGVKFLKVRSGGFHTWTEDEIAKYEARHPVGTKARLAFALLLYTAQRRGDVVRMGLQHIKDGILSIKQQKTGMLVEVPVHPELKAILDKTPSGHLTIVTTQYGKPFTPPGFTNWFRDRCNEAGLPKGCPPHGLRKAAAVRLAEAGCTTHEIASVTGHKTLKEVARYTETADRKKMAKLAHEKIMKKVSGTSSG